MIHPTLRFDLDLAPRAVSFTAPAPRSVRWNRRIAGALLLGAVLLLGLAPGCASRRNTRQAEVDAMRREYFELEDRFYDLEGRYRRAERRLRREGIELDSLGLEEESDAAGAGDAPIASPQGPPSASPEPTTADPQPIPATPETNEIPELPGPENAQRSWRRPPSAPAESRLSSRFRRPQTPTTSDTSTPAAQDSDEEAAPWTEPNNTPMTPITDWEVVAIEVPYARGFDSDGHPGDDGIMFVVEPRNASGQLVPAVAPMTVALIDPQSVGEAQRVGLWDLTAEEIAETQQEGLMSGSGITIRLPWQGESPARRQMLLFVRYGGAEEIQLEARTNVNLQSSSTDRSTWLPRPTPLRTAESENRSDRFARDTTSTSSRPSATDASSPSQDSSYARPASTSPGTSSTSPRTSRPAWSPYR